MGEGVRPATIAPTRVGGLYRDGAARITPALQRRVDAIAQDLRLFDFGRFDARFDCLANLASGVWRLASSPAWKSTGPAHKLSKPGTLTLACARGFQMIFAKQAALFAIGNAMRLSGVQPIGAMAMARLNQRHSSMLKRYPPSLKLSLALALPRNRWGVILGSVKKHIYIYSPSGAVRDKIAFKRGLKRLQKLGYELEVDRDALASDMRFAGDDATRLAALGRAAASGADVALMSRGGYGFSRLLGAIDYKALAKAIEKGTQFAGFSDFTALQMALMAKTGAVTWAGPAVCGDFGAAAPDDIMEACFDDWMCGQAEGTGWQLPRPRRQTGAIDSVARQTVKTTASESFTINNAVLWGGNLALLASLVGTPYLPDVGATKNGILFIEDTGEQPYQIERMLTQLLHAGLLAQQKAIVFGQFTDYKTVPHDKGFKLATVVQWLQSQVKAKVLTGLAFGHVATKVMLPVGQPVALTVQGRDAFVLWGHQHD